jgi:hypothetical protein
MTTPNSHTDVVYVGGSPRSGSTILGLLLGEVRGFFNAGEVRFLWRQLTESGKCGCGVTLAECEVWAPILRASLNGTDARAIRELAQASARHSLIRTLLTGLAGRAFGGRNAAGELSDGGSILPVYRAIAGATGAAAIVDTSKSPSYAYLLESAPDIRLHAVHLIRDPRAVVYSVLRERGHTMRASLRLSAILYQAAKWNAWNVWMETLVRWRASTYARFTYEDFVDAPEVYLGRILAQCGSEEELLPRCEGPARTAHLEVNHTAFGNGNRFKIGQVPIRVDDDWRRGMRRRERALVTAVSWPLLLRYRYSIGSRAASRRATVEPRAPSTADQSPFGPAGGAGVT